MSERIDEHIAPLGPTALAGVPKGVGRVLDVQACAFSLTLAWHGCKEHACASANEHPCFYVYARTIVSQQSGSFK